jgi:hypothetical protein
MNQSNAADSQEILWGTPAPVFLRLGGDMVPARIMGSCLVSVTDDQAFQQKVGDPVSLPAFLRPILANKVADVLGAMSSRVTDLTQLEGMKDEVAQHLNQQAEAEFGEAGLTIQEIVIQNIQAA